MKCKQCNEKLDVLRGCRKVRMQCKNCGKEYRIHEVADQLDSETAEILERYTSMIYD